MDGTTRLALLDGGGGPVEVGLDVPPGAVGHPPRDLDLGVAPGARWLARRAWRTADLSIELACAGASAERWVPGLEEPVLAGATVLARQALGAVSAGPARLEDGVVAQGFAGSGGGLEWRGRHVLGLTERDVLVCSVACGAPPGREEPCEAAAASLGLAGTRAEAAEPAWWARALLGAAAAPRASIAVGSAAVLGVVVLVLWRRPRPMR
jgi:hypothetical protein